MMQEIDLLLRCKQLGIYLKVEEGRLCRYAPAGALTPALLQELKARKDALIALLTRVRATPEEEVPVRPRHGLVPLTSAQRRLWFIDQLQGENPGYNIPTALLLARPYDVEVLRRALDCLVQRHEALRLTLHDEDGRPGQRPTVDAVALTVRSVAGTHDGPAMAEALRREIQGVFQLSRGPLCRFTLLRTCDGPDILSLITHHAVSDGWSMNVFHAELRLVYDALARQETPVLPELPLQFADYAGMHQQRLARRLPELTRFWEGYLRDAPHVLRLPSDHRRPTQMTFNGAEVPIRVDAATRAALERLAVEAGVTLFTVLLTAYQVLLARLADQTDFLIGTPVAGRDRRDVEQLVGMFVNTVVVRADLDPTRGFMDSVRAAHARTIDILQHGDMPLDLLVERLRPDRDLSRNPLFQVMFVYNAEVPLPPSALQSSQISFDTGMSHLDLTLCLFERDGRLQGSMSYNTDLFEAARVQQWADAFAAQLAALIAAPEAPPATWVLRHEPAHAATVPPADAAREADVGTEQRIIALWREILQLPEIDRYANFFSLGGHSLSATRIVARARSFAPSLQVSDLFRYPTPAELTAVIDTRREAADAAGAQGTRPCGTRGADAEIEVQQGAGPFPLSFEQQSLWFLQQALPEGGTYVVPMCYRLEGPLRTDLLHQALQALVARHEVLRTRLHVVDGQPVQTIEPVGQVDLPITQAPEGSPAEVEAWVTRELRDEAARGFDPSRGYVMRTRLLRQAPDTHVLTWCVHHIAADGWSMDVLAADLAEMYTALTEGRPAAWAPLPLRYVDVAAAGRRRAEADKERAHAWWRAYLADVPTVLELPRDFAGPRRASHTGEAVPMGLDPTLVRALRAVAARVGATQSMALTAAYAVLLHRFSGQSRFLMGMIDAGRNRVELEPLVGVLVHTLPLRIDLTDAPSFETLVARVRDESLAVLAHGQLPFSELLTLTDTVRDWGRTPLVQVMCAPQVSGRRTMTMGDLKVARRLVDPGWAGFDLSWSFWDTHHAPENGDTHLSDNIRDTHNPHQENFGDTHQNFGDTHQMALENFAPENGDTHLSDNIRDTHNPHQENFGDTHQMALENREHIRDTHDAAHIEDTHPPHSAVRNGRNRDTHHAVEGRLIYDTGLFTADTARRMAAHFTTLLHALTAAPTASIHAAADLPDAERRLLLTTWNDTAADFPDACLHTLFAAQAQRTPDAPALVVNGQCFRYAELLQRAHRRAHHLVALGVGSEDLVALLTPRSEEWVVSMLAVLETGAAFVPFDPAWPDTRLRQTLQDTGARLTVSDAHHGARLGTDAHVLVAGPDAAFPATHLGRTVPTQARVYVIYTSGSTGRPKGVEVPHRGLVNSVIWACKTLGIKSNDRCTQVAAPAFDAVALEIWPCLLAGACLHLVPEDLRMDARLLVAWIAAQEITVTMLPTALAEEVLKETKAHDWPVRVMYVGGDRFQPGPLQGLPFDLYNLYGPTEDSVCSTSAPLAPHDGDDPPIGKPLPNKQLYVVDPNLRPVPRGVAGELLVGGAGVARGYLGRPALTAERFIPDAWSKLPGARLYRTGDLVCYRENGHVSFKGRIDGQVKLRGFRIEPGEIATVLAGHPQVGQAVVVLRDDLPGGKGLAAYVTGHDLSVEALRAYLRERLPAYMVPAACVVMDSLPLTANGKIDRRALPRPEAVRTEERLSGTEAGTDTVLERTIREAWCDILEVPHVGPHDNFFDLGGHSLLLVRLARLLSKQLSRDISPFTLYRCPSPAALAAALTSQDTPKPVPTPVVAPASAAGKLAVIGMAGRFPGAEDLDAFRHLFTEGRVGLSRLTEAQLEASGIPASVHGDPHYVPVKGILTEADCFDATFFGMSAREALLTDPQHRVLLETAWSVLEHAGYDAGRYAGRIGLFAGCSYSSYLSTQLALSLDDALPSERYALALGNAPDFLVTRIAYKLGLTGPAISVQTACSTSLTAVDTAARMLATGACDMAIAGGVSVTYPLAGGYTYEPGVVASPDGCCRPFDAAARGIVTGNGVGLVLLKDLARAVADGDTVHAVLEATATNNDGARKVGFTAPGVTGQAAAFAQALARAGRTPAEIGYAETHGTGTPMGDPIELAAMAQVFGNLPEGAPPCALGAVKANVGHLDAAAGITGLIKAALVVKHGVIPPLTHFTTPNPQLGLADTPFTVPRTAQAWPEGRPRCAMVNALGMGGTNAVAILSQPPSQAPPTDAPATSLLVLSAASPDALNRACARLADHLEAHPDARLADVAHTLQLGRAELPWRRGIVATTTTDAVAHLRHTGVVGRAEATPPRMIFLFPGVGSQRVGMGRELYAHEPVFRACIDRCAEALRGYLDRDLRQVLYAEEGDQAEARRLLESPRWNMPALFATQMAMVHLMRSWGIEPAAAFGLSLGEFAAACTAGVLSPEDAVRLVATRGRLCAESAPAGAMAALHLSADETAAALFGSLEISGYNAPRLTVVSGPRDEMDRLTADMELRGVRVVPLASDRALHSAALEPAVDALAEAASVLDHHGARLPYLSNVTGDWVAIGTAPEPAYWGTHLRRPILVEAALSAALAEPDTVLLEVGPGSSVTGLARLNPAWTDQHTAVTTMVTAEPGRAETAAALLALGTLWRRGAAVDWHALHAPHGKRFRVPLPTYPFERTRFAPAPAPRTRSRTSAIAESSPAVADEASWFVPVWRQVAAASPRRTPTHWWILAEPSDGVHATMAALRQRGDVVSLATHPDGPSAGWTAAQAADLVAAIQAAEHPAHLVYWRDGFRDHAVRGLHDLLALGKALAVGPRPHDLRLTVVSRGMQGLPEHPPTHPETALWLGPCLVLPQELDGMRCRGLDLGAREAEDQPEQIAAELATDDADDLVALRGTTRWVRGHAAHPTVPQPAGTEVPSVREGGTYLITGGLGGLGLTLAEHLARTARARLILMGRAGLPPRAAWPQLLADTETSADVCAGIRAVTRLEALGAEVLVVAADVADAASVTAALDTARARFGRLHGVVHAAGVAERQRFRHVTEAATTAVLRPKLEGTRVLHAATVVDDLDWLVLCASLSAAAGGGGLAAYAGANAFLDAFAQAQVPPAGRPARVLSLAWPGLRMGMALREAAPGDLAHAALMEGPEAVAWFARRLVDRTPHLVLSLQGDPDLLRRPDAGAPTVPAVPAAVDPAEVSPAETVSRLWHALLGGAAPREDDDFFHCGGSSLLAIGLLTRLRSALGVSLYVDDLIDHPTLGALCRRVEAALGASVEASRAPAPPARAGSAERYCVTLRTGTPEEPPLFLFPPAGGNLLSYQVLARFLPERVPVIGVRQRGADGCEPFDTTRETMMDHYEAVVRAVCPSGPVRLVGYSMGGLVAYETARRLTAAGREVTLCGLIDTPGPGDMLNLRATPLDGRAEIRAYLEAMSPDALRQVDEAIALSREAGPLYADMARFYEIFASNGRVLAGLEQLPPYAGRLLFLRAAERDPWNPQRPETAWIDLAEGGMEIHVVPGNHMTMVAPPHVAVLAAHLCRALGHPPSPAPAAPTTPALAGPI